jgi:hypothetical protein
MICLSGSSTNPKMAVSSHLCKAGSPWRCVHFVGSFVALLHCIGQGSNGDAETEAYVADERVDRVKNMMMGICIVVVDGQETAEGTKADMQ